jgi:hypothetical protein
MAEIVNLQEARLQRHIKSLALRSADTTGGPQSAPEIGLGPAEMTALAEHIVALLAVNAPPLKIIAELREFERVAHPAWHEHVARLGEIYARDRQGGSSQ